MYCKRFIWNCSIDSGLLTITVLLLLQFSYIIHSLTHTQNSHRQTHTALVTENSVHDGVIRAADYPAYQKYVFNDIQSFITVTIKAHQRHL